MGVGFRMAEGDGVFLGLVFGCKAGMWVRELRVRKTMYFEVFASAIEVILKTSMFSREW